MGISRLINMDHQGALASSGYDGQPVPPTTSPPYPIPSTFTLLSYCILEWDDTRYPLPTPPVAATVGYTLETA